MCGRVRIPSSVDIVTNYHIEHIDEAAPVHSQAKIITPGDMIPVIVLDNDRVTLTSMRWGFGDVYNTRSETAAIKSFWAESYTSRRCLLPFDAFYEGRRWFSRDRPLYGASIWRPSESCPECSLLTKRANEHVEPYHPRMPLIYDEFDDARVWLEEATLS